MKCRVSLQPGDNPKSEHLGKQDYEGDHATKDEAIAAWKTKNGLDGIGVESWPVKVEEIKPEPVKAPDKAKDAK